MGYGSRLKEQPADELVQSAFAHEVADGPLLYRGMSLADLAHIVMLCEVEVIPKAARTDLLSGLLKLHEISGDKFPFDPVFGDVYTNREQALRREVPQGGADGWLRAGRARRESSTVGYLIATRDALLALMAAHADLIAPVLRQAGAHLDTLMPDYTYLLKAHPTTLAHYLMAFVSPMLRDIERLRAAFGRVNRSPAGGGSVNGSRLPLNRERVAQLLGFDGVVTHTRDAMWEPDLPVEVLGAVMALMVNLDRLAEDLQLFATDEFGFAELADAHSRTSVIMPQKKNPYSLSFVRGAARNMLGALVSVTTTNMTPSGQPDNRIFAYGEVPRALDAATRAVRLMAGVMDRITFNVELMARRAAEGYSGSTDLGDYLSEVADVDPRTAHRIIGWAVREAAQTRAPITAPLLDRAAQEIIGRPLNLNEEAVARVQQPQAIVKSRTGTGGASELSTQAMIETAQRSVNDNRDWIDGTRQRLEAAEAELLRIAKDIAR
jgi:argininosuccinate lyase